MRRRNHLIGFGAATLAIGLVHGGVHAAPVNRQAPISLFNGVEEIVEACTSSTTFVNMPSMTRTFTQGTGAAEEIAVVFQAASSLSGSEQFDTGFVRLQIDGVTVGPADGLIPLIGPGQSGTHGFNWQTKPLAAGNHTAKVQWRTDLGSSFCVDARTLNVLHR